jgi:hypothetical protein
MIRDPGAQHGPPPSANPLFQQAVTAHLDAIMAWVEKTLRQCLGEDLAAQALAQRITPEELEKFTGLQVRIYRELPDGEGSMRTSAAVLRRNVVLASQVFTLRTPKP